MSDPARHDTTIWVVSDGRRGIENQALGLAEAVGRELKVPHRIERITVRQDGFVTLPAHSHPDIWIGCGRAAVPFAGRHRRIFPDCKFVYVQDPRHRHDDFDLIVAPSHDRLVRSNALSMTGSPNRVTPEVLAAANARFPKRLAMLPGPRVAVLIGGNSKRFKLDNASARYLTSRLDGLLADGASLMVTVSRRTPATVRATLRAHFGQRERVWYHDGEGEGGGAGENPYFTFLAAAEWIFVTEESTNMLVEASTTGAPVYVLPLTGTPGKFALLHAELEACGAVRPYLGRLDRWTYPPLNETRRAARAVLDQFRGHRGQSDIKAA
ncbi:mitochondrial fission ELM1 family protein [Maricaulis sp.]|uniref:mitochondrial fission ELM1 family protein n=1 Tax=Maricaulis sp. TaxID=1486257 RepID=UPI002B270F90|nr:mitochondrial fission ELM1 family protein [Maricaulis sp.]